MDEGRAAATPDRGPRACGRAAAGLRRAGRGLLDLLFPPACYGCHKPGVLLCSTCLAAIEPPPQRACLRCGAPAVVDYCSACRPSPLDGVISLAVFQPPLQPAIHAFKYAGISGLAAPLAACMAEAWPRTGLSADAFVPVALHARRIRERGYNQAALLVRELAAATGLRDGDGWVQRRRDTRPQVGLGQAERRANVADAFSADPCVAGQAIVLIDDVCTTGATLEACAVALKGAGAASVWGYTLARARWGADGSTSVGAIIVK